MLHGSQKTYQLRDFVYGSHPTLGPIFVTDTLSFDQRAENMLPGMRPLAAWPKAELLLVCPGNDKGITKVSSLALSSLLVCIIFLIGH